MELKKHNFKYSGRVDRTRTVERQTGIIIWISELVLLLAGETGHIFKKIL